MKISGQAKLAALVGNPIAQSLSPRIHAHWLEAYGIDGAYVPLLVRKEDFAVVLRGLRAAGFAGVNVTVPHKEAAFALAERHDRFSRESGAANLLLFHGGILEGRNADVTGLIASLTEALGADGLRGKSTVVLGSGGAARAAVLALSALGASEVRLVARNSARAEQIARTCSLPASSTVQGFSWSTWPQHSTDIALLLNATSAGMRGNAPLALSLDALPRDAAVCDIVYNPLETPLLQQARRRGHRVIDGLGMLMHQAVPAFEAFYGVRPVVSPSLRAELEEALRERA